MSREWPRAALDSLAFSLSVDSPWPRRMALMRHSVACETSVRLARVAAAFACGQAAVRASAPPAVAPRSAIEAIATTARWRPLRNMLRTYERTGALPTAIYRRAIGLACHGQRRQECPEGMGFGAVSASRR